MTGPEVALAQAAFDLLALDVGLTVYRGRVPNGVLVADQPVPPYVSVYSDVTTPTDPGTGADDMAETSTQYVAAWYCHCVGEDEVAALAVAQRVASALLKKRPTVSGFAAESVGPIRQAASDPADRDESLGVPVFSALRVYELIASA